MRVLLSATLSPKQSTTSERNTPNTNDQINDLAFGAVRDPSAPAGAAPPEAVRFNVVVGGHFSLKRNMLSVPLGVSVSYAQVVPFSLAVLRVFRCVLRWCVGRWGGAVCCACCRRFECQNAPRTAHQKQHQKTHPKQTPTHTRTTLKKHTHTHTRHQPPMYRDFGPRADRQKSRLIWCIEALGMDGFVAKVMRGKVVMGGGGTGDRQPAPALSRRRPPLTSPLAPRHTVFPL